MRPTRREEMPRQPSLPTLSHHEGTWCEPRGADDRGQQL